MSVSGNAYNGAESAFLDGSLALVSPILLVEILVFNFTKT